MSKKEARSKIGGTVEWIGMDARIDITTIILETVKAHGIAVISFRVGTGGDRFITYRHVSELY